MTTPPIKVGDILRAKGVRWMVHELCDDGSLTLVSVGTGLKVNSSKLGKLTPAANRGAPKR